MRVRLIIFLTILFLFDVFLDERDIFLQLEQVISTYFELFDIRTIVNRLV